MPPPFRPPLTGAAGAAVCPSPSCCRVRRPLMRCRTCPHQGKERLCILPRSVRWYRHTSAAHGLTACTCGQIDIRNLTVLGGRGAPACRPGSPATAAYPAHITAAPRQQYHRSHKPNSPSRLVQTELHSSATHQQLLVVRGAGRQWGALHAQLLQQRQPGQHLSGRRRAVCSCWNGVAAIMPDLTRPCWSAADLHGCKRGDDEGVATGGRGSPGGLSGT